MNQITHKMPRKIEIKDNNKDLGRGGFVLTKKKREKHSRAMILKNKIRAR
jgi:hypothetical protein